MSILLRLCCGLVLLASSLVHAATLENPSTGLNYSGIGIISGWKCTANGPLTVRFNDGDPIPLAYGNARADVRNAGACPSAQVGFVSIMNWAELGDGEHTAVAYDNGVEFARSTFEVTTLGTSFLQGASRGVTVFDFPELGTDVVLQWQPTLQNFVITDRVESPSDALFGSRFYWVQNTYPREPGADDTVYWARTDGSAAGSIKAAMDSRIFADKDLRHIADLAIDSGEDKLYLLLGAETGGAIHRVNLDGTEYEEVWVYESDASGYGLGVGHISLDERGNIYLSIRDASAHYDVRELRRFSIEEALSYPGDGPPETFLPLSRPSMPSDGFALQTVWDTTQIQSLFGSSSPKDIHIIGDTMYFPTYDALYRARTDGSGVRTEYSPPANSAMGSLEVRDGTLWWVSYESNKPRIYKRQMGAAPGSEELVYEEDVWGIGPIVVSPIDQTIYFPVGAALHRYQQGAESSEVHLTTSVAANILELAP